ncbi:MAG TPA: hypothetical protein VN672_11310 [Solirubrobacteraceae bacterium]|nr:hypothetical protein [Solirubrobacteraceae bacterium]
MTDAASLLQRHRPVVRYDSHEVYFADSAAGWTDSPGQVLRRGPQGRVLAAVPESPPTPKLSLAFLGPRYASGERAEREDLIGCPSRNYSELARELHAQPGYANRVYGRSAEGTDGRLWLQYWFFYFYNDLELLGSAFPAGLHEGDWEMIQLRLDRERRIPDLAVYAQHRRAEARHWSEVERIGETRPVVYVARGSHAAYFTGGRHWGEVWFDHADGEGFSPELTLEIADDEDPTYAWMRWPGFWGDTKPNPDRITHPFDDSSPRGPGGHDQWKDPHRLLMTVDGYERFEPGPVEPVPTAAGVASHSPAVPPPGPEPPAPEVSLTRSARGLLSVDYRTSEWPRELRPVRLVVTLNSVQDRKPPLARSVPISSSQGTVDVPVELDPTWTYDVHVSIAGCVVGGSPESPPLTSPATSASMSG